MAATEVIRFDFRAQAVSGVPSGTPKPSYLFEHSPPSRRPDAKFLSFIHRTIPPRYVRPAGSQIVLSPLWCGKKGMPQCKRPMYTMQFC
jgi:hypothetical protein